MTIHIIKKVVIIYDVIIYDNNNTIEPYNNRGPWINGEMTGRSPPLYYVVVVFFTLTDRASTIPNNTRGCQSGTWSAGQKKIRGTSTKLQ